MVGFLQMRLQRLEPQGHLGQSIVQANQIASGVTAQLCRMAEFPLHGQHIFLPEVLQSDGHGKAPIGANLHRI